MTDFFDLRGKKIWIAGHQGLVGKALLRELENHDCEILTASKCQLDLRRQSETEDWIADKRPGIILVAAAKVGGIGANAEFPAQFIYDNLAIAQNVIHGAYKAGTSKLVFLGSSCIYPKQAKQPIKEEELLNGALEATNEAYAVAKIAGLKLCQFYRRQYGCDFISLMPCNLYGPGDRWNSGQAHVIPALISRMHQAKGNGGSVDIWGSGKPLREFLFADDLAKGVIHSLRHYSDELHLNIGSGEEISIADLAFAIADIVRFTGEIKFNDSKPDGTYRKLLDSRRMNALGWKAETPLKKGLQVAYEDFLASA